MSSRHSDSSRLENSSSAIGISILFDMNSELILAPVDEMYMKMGRFSNDYEISEEVSFSEYIILEGGYYTGYLKRSKPEGFGCLLLNTGQIYEGAFHRGKIQGKGRMIDLDGTAYEGIWKHNDLGNGGKITWLDGSVYIGKIKKIKPHGDGVLVLEDSSKYEGQFRKGFMHGTGVKYFSDGRIYAGQWKNSKIHGFGAMHWPEKFFLGGFINEEIVGIGKMEWGNGDIYLGQFLEGKRHGLGCIIGNEQLRGKWNCDAFDEPMRDLGEFEPENMEGKLMEKVANVFKDDPRLLEYAEIRLFSTKNPEAQEIMDNSSVSEVSFHKNAKIHKQQLEISMDSGQKFEVLPQEVKENSVSSSRLRFMNKNQQLDLELQSEMSECIETYIPILNMKFPISPSEIHDEIPDESFENSGSSNKLEYSRKGSENQSKISECVSVNIPEPKIEIPLTPSIYQDKSLINFDSLEVNSEISECNNVDIPKFKIKPPPTPSNATIIQDEVVEKFQELIINSPEEKNEHKSDSEKLEKDKERDKEKERERKRKNSIYKIALELDDNYSDTSERGHKEKANTNLSNKSNQFLPHEDSEIKSNSSQWEEEIKFTTPALHPPPSPAVTIRMTTKSDDSEEDSSELVPHLGVNLNELNAEPQEEVITLPEFVQYRPSVERELEDSNISPQPKRVTEEFALSRENSLRDKSQVFFTESKKNRIPDENPIEKAREVKPPVEIKKLIKVKESRPMTEFPTSNENRLEKVLVVHSNEHGKHPLTTSIPKNSLESSSSYLDSPDSRSTVPYSQSQDLSASEILDSLDFSSLPVASPDLDILLKTRELIKPFVFDDKEIEINTKNLCFVPWTASDDGFYMGQVMSNGARHGVGVELLDYCLYEGCWSNNMRCGLGRVITIVGDNYEGFWFNNTKRGFGAMWKPAGEGYVGDWDLDLPEGKGTDLSVIEKYEGDFHMGIRHGRGVLTQANLVFTGEFHKGTPNGYGVVKWSNKSAYAGIFINGESRGMKGVFMPSQSVATKKAPETTARPKSVVQIGGVEQKKVDESRSSDEVSEDFATLRSEEKKESKLRSNAGSGNVSMEDKEVSFGSERGSRKEEVNEMPRYEEDFRIIKPVLVEKDNSQPRGHDRHLGTGSVSVSENANLNFNLNVNVNERDQQDKERREKRPEKAILRRVDDKVKRDKKIMLGPDIVNESDDEIQRKKAKFKNANKEKDAVQALKEGMREEEKKNKRKQEEKKTSNAK